MRITHLTPADYRTMPWKNGLGTTTEIAADPPAGLAAGGRFLWRLSLADVAADGPFSAFPGYDRTILVAEGAGMRLDFAEAPTVTVAERFRPVSFSGDWTTRCTLLDGPIRDFNVMVDRARARAEVRMLAGAGPFPLPPASLHLIHLFQGEAALAGQRFTAGDTLRLEGVGPGPVRVTGTPALQAALIALHLRGAAGGQSN